MCLSDAYEIKDGKQNLVCSRVCNVSADGENVTLTDLMGIRKIVPGKLKKVDLMPAGVRSIRTPVFLYPGCRFFLHFPVLPFIVRESAGKGT